MAKRFTDTELWDKEWFMLLPCKLKCLVKFVRDKADLCGVWSPNWVITNAYIGDFVSEKDLLLIDNGNQFKKIGNGKIFCLGFVEFQYGQLSEKSPVHRKILSLLSQNDLLEIYKKIPYQYPINRVQEEEEEKEKEKEEEKEEEEGQPSKNFIIPMMLQKWYSVFPHQAKNDFTDPLSMSKILECIKKQERENDVGSDIVKTKILTILEQMAAHVALDVFWVNKPLKSISNHAEEFYNHVKNPLQNGSANNQTIGGRNNGVQRTRTEALRNF